MYVETEKEMTKTGDDSIKFVFVLSNAGMVDGSCWFLVCPSTKQRSDGEKVRTYIQWNLR